MPIDMKEVIARAALSLLLEKKVKKITVKDIVNECNITRQSFYYHFTDIPDLLKWALQQGEASFLKELQEIPDGEGRIRYILLIAVNAKPYIQRGIESNYGPEIEKLLLDQIKRIISAMGEAQEAFSNLDPFTKELTLRYHCYATLGLVHDWTDEHTEQIDRIAHEIYLLVTGCQPHME